MGGQPSQPQKRFSSLSDLGQSSPSTGHDGKARIVRVRLDTSGRKGKAVTLVEGLQHNPQTMNEIARILKQHCGAGGTVKEGNVEIQGDQRRRVGEKLQAMNYVVTTDLPSNAALTK